MTMYGYVSGYYRDKFIKDPDFERHATVLLGSGISIENCFADRFSHTNKERYKLHKFFACVAKEGDILFVPELTDLYSNVRELCCLMHEVENTGIIIKSSDMDLSDDSDSSNWILASQLAHLDYLHYLRHKRVITPIYRQAYEYLQTHTYLETQIKFHLSKSTLYRIKKQINNRKQPINTPQSYDASRGDVQ